MGAPALAPRRAPVQRPSRRAPSARPAKRERARPRANGALASAARPRRSAGPGRPAGPRRQAQGGFAQPALAGAALIPHAAARTAGAVRDISDSSLIVRLTLGRGWIAVLCALLGGIVALNVVSLSINSTSGRVSQAIEEYERSNSALRADLAEQLSASRVEGAAAELGLAVPPPEQITYLQASDGDLERLAEVWGGDSFLSYESSSTAVPTVATPASAPVESAPATTTPAPAASPPAPAPSSGGGGAATGGVGL
jgi:hypothetical protein